MGRLVAEKGLPLLLEAAKWLKEQGVAFRLCFAGGGPEQGQLAQIVQRLGFVGGLRNVLAGPLWGLRTSKKR